jgi:hypothetical protein
VRTLPRDLAALARKARTDRLQIQLVHRNLEFFVREMDRSSNRLSFAIVIAAVVVGSALVLDAEIGPMVLGYPALGLTGFLLAAVLGLRLAIGILRSGRLRACAWPSPCRTPAADVRCLANHEAPSAATRSSVPGSSNRWVAPATT